MPLTFEIVKNQKLSPMMAQYIEIKEQHMDCLLFFRLGDFYELFLDDALIASNELEIALTARDCGLNEKAPMCGVPYHSAKSYISRLINAGYNVAICEQVEDPAQAKGIVRREITQIVTPGTIVDPEELPDDQNNYLVSIYMESSYYALAVIELISGTFFAKQWISLISKEKLIDEIYRYRASEVIVSEEILSDKQLTLALKPFKVTLCSHETYFSKDFASYIQNQNINDDSILAQRAATALLHYVNRTQRSIPEHLEEFKILKNEAKLSMSENTRRNLELFETIQDKKKKGSLLFSIDNCKTAMGRRKLRSWLEEPLFSVSEIMLRQNFVEVLKEAFILRQEIRETMTGLQDIERLTGKIALSKANARDLYALANSLKKIPNLKICLSKLKETSMGNILLQNLDPITSLSNTLLKAIKSNAALTITDGNIITDNYDEQVDRYRLLSHNSQKWLADFEQREKDKYNIKNLKVGYNRVFGYYIEVSKSNLDLVPSSYIRKQTLSNSERYATEELKNMENELLSAAKKLEDREYQIFIELRELCKSYISSLRKNSEIIAQLDVFQSMAELAEKSNYCKPEISDKHELIIKEGRHPVVENLLNDDIYVPNDTYMNYDDTNLILLTGPNMSGKSTYMRQVALIVILAQIGSFVPASYAKIGLVDQIFTRIGASDNVASGRSTFMVEMEELAYILKEATNQSLLILDEIGRGTSTYDGLSIAWAVIEEVSNKNILYARTLFATHYHELTILENSVTGLRNFHIEVDEKNGEIKFLHHIRTGEAKRSYGIEVAKLAGVNQEVINRAYEVLHSLEKDKLSENISKSLKNKKKTAISSDSNQIDLFTSSIKFNYSGNIVKELNSIDINSISPLQAMAKLDELIKLAKKGNNDD